MRKIILVLSFLISIISIHSSKAQLAKFQAIYIYNFTNYIEWPAGFQSGNFIIGVLDNNPIVNELQNIAKQRKVFNQPIEVRVFNTIASISKCHILFIPKARSASINEAVAHAGTTGTLLVMEQPGSTGMGAAINFILVDNKLKFELRRANATFKGLKIKTEFDKLAYRIY